MRLGCREVLEEMQTEAMSAGLELRTIEIEPGPNQVQCSRR